MENDTFLHKDVFTNTSYTPETATIPQYIMYQIYALNGILVLLGVLGNILVCFIVSSAKKMNSVAKTYLVNLAVADLMILIISYPLWILQALLPNNWPFGSLLCKLLFPLSDCFYGVSLGCMMAISVHRYWKIIHSKRRKMKYFHAKSVVVFFYGISIMTISIPGYPIMHYSETVTLLNNTIGDITLDSHMIVSKQCYWLYPSETYKRTHMLFLTVAWYIIPLLLIMLTFLRIKFYLQRKMSYHWVRQSNHNILLKSRVDGIKKALRLLAPVVIVFAVLMLPWNILRVVSVFKTLDYRLLHNQIFSLIASTMLVINSVVNPFIYYITSNDFRLEFQNQFKILLILLKLTSASPIVGNSRSGGDNSFKHSSGSHNYQPYDSRSLSETYSSISEANYPNFDQIFSTYNKVRDRMTITEEPNSGSGVSERLETTNEEADNDSVGSEPHETTNEEPNSGPVESKPCETTNEKADSHPVGSEPHETTNEEADNDLVGSEQHETTKQYTVCNDLETVTEKQCGYFKSVLETSETGDLSVHLKGENDYLLSPQDRSNDDSADATFESSSLESKDGRSLELRFDSDVIQDIKERLNTKEHKETEL